MDLIAMAALLIQQSSDIETTVRFDTHFRGAAFSCVNYLSPSDRYGPGELRPNGTFLCEKQDGSSPWTAAQSDIIAGLEDEKYRVCVSAGGMAYPRERTGGICIGDL